MKRYALLSVYNKSGIEDFAQELLALDFSLISSGGTARHLREKGFEVIDVSELTKFPELMDGRVKTLHPAIHGGILARRQREDDLASLEEQGFFPIDVVCVNLYPFAEVLAKGQPEEVLIENIDIGGPTLLRAAAKNFRDVFVISDPGDYKKAAFHLKNSLQGDYYQEEGLAFRKLLALKVFQSTAAYDSLIASYFAETTAFTDRDMTISDLDESSLFPPVLDLEAKQVATLRYGENPHQRAAFYRFPEISDSGLAAAKQLHGKELSYNNIQDANAALELLYEFKDPCVVAVKHMNPCGLAIAEDIYTAWHKAYEADPVSIFGGIVAANREIDAASAKEMNDIFLEIVIAPGFSKEALEILQSKKNIRLLELPMKTKHALDSRRVVSVMDGLLIQERDAREVTRKDCSLMGKHAPKESEWQDLLHAFKLVKHCKSNAIVVFKDGVSLGIGVGQSNRIGAAKLALDQAGEKAKGAVLASDAFFPMSDTVELAASRGISAIIQPGGSIKDAESIGVCDDEKIAMVATGIRHFKH